MEQYRYLLIRISAFKSMCRDLCSIKINSILYPFEVSKSDISSIEVQCSELPNFAISGICYVVHAQRKTRSAIPLNWA